MQTRYAGPPNGLSGILHRYRGPEPDAAALIWIAGAAERPFGKFPPASPAASGAVFAGCGQRPRIGAVDSGSNGNELAEGEIFPSGFGATRPILTFAIPALKAAVSRS